MLKNGAAHNRGFSLLETLVAMAAGSVVLATVLSLTVSQLVTSNTNLRLSRLNQELQGITDQISRDIQRAGFHPAASRALAQPNASTYTQTQTHAHETVAHLVFSPLEDLYPTLNAAQCIRLKFWDNEAPSGEQLVVRIYHFQPDSGVLRLYSHHDVYNTQPLSAVCGLGNQLIASQEIRLEQLSFRLTDNSGAQGIRSVALSITGAYRQQSELRQTLQRRVLLRNRGANE